MSPRAGYDKGVPMGGDLKAAAAGKVAHASSSRR